MVRSSTVTLVGAVALPVALVLTGPAREPLLLGLVLACTFVLVAVSALNERALRRTRDQLAGLAMRDPVTGIANRRAFDEALAHALERCRLGGDPVTVVLVDIDGFKQINDEHGHATGDAVLCAVAEALARDTRDLDVVTRWGGDEFAVVLRGTSVADAGPVAVRLCATMGNAVSYPSISLSMGWATAPEHGTDAASLLAAADESLYAAKRSRELAHAARAARTPDRPLDSVSL
jgi:diguanylate cyclase (GGDEF)-like protein